MSYIEGHMGLIQAAKGLKADWQQVQRVWRDDKCRQFEQTYIAPLEAEIRRTVIAMERMGTMIHRARHDCAESEGSL